MMDVNVQLLDSFASFPNVKYLAMISRLDGQYKQKA